MSAGARLPGAPQPMHYWPGAGGIRLAGDAWGPADGPLVVLLHGGGQTRHAWKDVGTTLGAAGYRAVALDARGHGDSEWAPDGRYTQDVMVDDLASVVAALGNARPTLVGASMGGGTSLVAIGEDRIDATALVLVDIAPRVERDGVARIRAFMAQKPEGFATLEEVADAIASYQPQRPRPRSLDGLAKNLRLGDDGRYRWHWDPRFLARQIDAEQRQNRFEACAARLSLPVMLARGGMSDVLTEEGVRAFLALCPHAEYVNVSDAAHMIAGDRNDVFGQAVIDFLARAVPVGGKPVHPPHATHAQPPWPAGDFNDVP